MSQTSPCDRPPSPSVWSDELLLERMLARDERAWREFVRRFEHLMFHAIRSVTKRFSTILASTDTQDIYAVLLSRLCSGDMHRLRLFNTGRGVRLSTWLGVLARNTAWDFLRATARAKTTAHDHDVAELEDSSPDPTELIYHRQLWKRTEAALGSLTDRDKQFVRLYCMEELEPDRISEVMNISVTTVYSKKHKLRARMSSLFAERTNARGERARRLRTSAPAASADYEESFHRAATQP